MGDSVISRNQHVECPRCHGQGAPGRAGEGLDYMCTTNTEEEKQAPARPEATFEK